MNVKYLCRQSQTVRSQTALTGKFWKKIRWWLQVIDSIPSMDGYTASEREAYIHFEKINKHKDNESSLYSW